MKETKIEIAIATCSRVIKVVLHRMINLSLRQSRMIKSLYEDGQSFLWFSLIAILVFLLQWAFNILLLDNWSSNLEYVIILHTPQDNWSLIKFFFPSLWFWFRFQGNALTLLFTSIILSQPFALTIH